MKDDRRERKAHSVLHRRIFFITLVISNGERRIACNCPDSASKPAGIDSCMVAAA